ncbi:SDR family NAD(P)-dependent oxidoreductase [Cystobacter fuscus]
MAGRYPQARNVHEFWQNLAAGKDCITEIPKARWDNSLFFDADKNAAGKTYSKWGGFIDGAYEFDPLFFNISPREAEIMDPQERLFLQCVYETLEDAGYTRGGAKARASNVLDGQVGVFVGVMYEEYQLFGAQGQLLGQPLALAGNPASIANRVSYFCNFNGPSMSIDTMCSSSLSAIHLACQSLKWGDCEVAIAGGVNLSLHPNKYLLLSQGKFASTNGRCESFGAGGDGYVPGEGVGAILLKPLAKAIADKDRIYGVIKGTAVNHGGKTNGYSVPNPQAQSSVIGHALKAAGIDARAMSYVEAHGTGTALGDPIEITGLSKTFREHTAEKQFCAIGSVKSNIGHCESAAGIAGVTKVLLQMQHGKLAPSLHAETLNPYIDFADTPFVVQRELAEWRRPILSSNGTSGEVPRIAGVSSFGAGGSNAHVVIAEYLPDGREERPSVVDAAHPTIVPISARTEERLQAQVKSLLEWLARPESADLSPADLAYTLQVGREVMEARMGVIAASLSDLVEKLQRFLAGKADTEDVIRVKIKRDNDALVVFAPDADLDAMIRAWAEKKKYEKLLELWVNGVPLDWQLLYGSDTPRRIALPTYPFAREHCCAFDGGSFENTAPQSSRWLHPLVQANTSDFTEQRFTSVFTGQEFFLRDHVVNSSKLMPGAAFLEMAIAAARITCRAQVAPSTPVALKNVVWAQPLRADGLPQELHIGLQPGATGDIQFRAYSAPTGLGASAAEFVLHSEGAISFEESAADTALELQQLEAACGLFELTAEQCYEAYRAAGIVYGPSHRGIQHVWIGQDQALAQLVLPASIQGTDGDFTLHPSLLDAALQASIGVMRQPARQWSSASGSSLYVPFAVDEITVLDSCTASMWVWVRLSEEHASDATTRKLDLDLADEHGRVRVRIRGLSFRVLEGKPDRTKVLLFPQWKEQPAMSASPDASNVNRTVLLLEQPEVAALLEERDGGDVIVVAAEKQTPDRRYSAYGLQILEKTKSVMQDASLDPVLIQLVIAASADSILLSGFAAMLRTAHLENPRITGQVILLDKTDTAETAVAKILENRAHPQDTLVRYVNARREVSTWVEDSTAAAIPLPWKERGVYLVTGGMGALGLLFAREIATQIENATLILTGRSPLSPKKRKALEELEACGARACYEQVDVSSQSEVDALIARTLQKCGRIDGVIHSAGVTRDTFILKKQAGEFLDVLAPKVSGVVNLDSATRTLPLDFFVTFSSTSGASGNLGQVDYAAANAFMDAYAWYRGELVARGERSGRSLSINWPLWADGGMHVSSETEAMLRSRYGIVPLETAAGVAAFYQILNSPHSQVMVLEGEPSRIRDASNIASPAQGKISSVSSAMRTTP